ncbi:hypothetical protein VIN01S_24380 [Vibrio inusitatus NBRC 102082]|uniref:DUF1468 domain-containing protein n=1 Tax=Vibrio inusitatus NBRC 102082 TaxID=1219070 RepID=A0A4Y3HZH5_9VIBR|nr:tripartite tricarboxylate transporter TctB family protein [Vibrio inusitatus]GEA51634.1 hypothetical protein VIN01S_24380 [Vibrio inusitatus NBRC 102082]
MPTLSRDKLTAFGGVFIATMVIIATKQYSFESSYFPISLSVAILALSTLLLLRRSKPTSDHSPEQSRFSGEEVIQIKSAIGVFVGIIAYSVTLRLVNYEIATVLFLGIAIWTLGYRKIVPVLLIALGLSAGLHFVFFELLSVSRPESLFFY